MTESVAVRPLEKPCPVCAHTLAVPFFAGGQQPLATLGWPQSPGEALAMPRLPLDFVQCPCCSHVWNTAFSYDDVPYRSQPNRMYNSGQIWQGHLAETRDRLLAYLPAAPTVVEIGCGDGHFLRGLAEARAGQGDYIGFDPNSSPETGQGVRFQARLFEPLRDVPALLPDAIVIRHVLEHFTAPAVLLEQLAWAVSQSGKVCHLFAEVPCIDRVFDSDRLADFFYEHVSHFTSDSFRHLLTRAGSLCELVHGYDGEVVFACVELGVAPVHVARAAAADAFAQRSVVNRARIADKLAALHASGVRVAIWGGTGKSAAFIHHYALDAARFPLVVDSDAAKAGTYVPGTGQPIHFRDQLKAQPVDVVIIPTQWRAGDIVAEMTREGIVAGQVLIEHGGDLVDFFTGTHPYRLRAAC